jgi:hypothetical protein
VERSKGTIRRGSGAERTGKNFRIIQLNHICTWLLADKNQFLNFYSTENQ